MMTTEQGWGCELDDVLVERRRDGVNTFRLEVPSFRLAHCAKNLNKLPIVGVSGAGKSTLLNIMAAVEWPHGKKSKVKWTFPDGQHFSWGPRGVSPGRILPLRQRYFGFAFQSSTLTPYLTVEDNLSYPLEISGVPRTRALAKARTILERVMNEDVGPILGHYPHQLSGGQKQRVALIQAMIHNPVVLFADEPTGSLDPITRQVVMKVLMDWVDAAPDERLLVWVTHHAKDTWEHNVVFRVKVSNGGCRLQPWNEAANIWEDQHADH